MNRAAIRHKGRWASGAPRAGGRAGGAIDTGAGAALREFGGRRATAAGTGWGTADGAESRREADGRMAEAGRRRRTGRGAVGGIGF